MKVREYYDEIIQFSQEQVLLFGQITGDLNPIHFDDDEAIKAKFESKIIHGFLSGAVFSKIIGMHFPGQGSIYLSQTMKFRKPMFINKDYIAHVEVVEIFSEKKRCILKTQVFESNTGDICIDGEAIILNNSLI